MDRSPTIEAARHFLSVVWDEDAPSDDVLLAALDRLVAVYHDTPDVGPSETELEAPKSGGPPLYKEVASRFPEYGYYPVSDPAGSPGDKDAALTGDAVDDLMDLTMDMREAVWLADHIGPDDAHWSFRLLFFHWGRHARGLSLYLHARLFG